MKFDKYFTKRNTWISTLNSQGILLNVFSFHILQNLNAVVSGLLFKRLVLFRYVLVECGNKTTDITDKSDFPLLEIDDATKADRFE